MRMLVAIANYGTKNQGFLEILLDSLRDSTHDLHFVAMSEAPKEVAPDVEVVVGYPGPTPMSLPFAHRELFATRRDDYDLFLYTEDDNLIWPHNIEAFIEASEVLPPGDLAGFLRYEEYPDGTRSYCSIHSHYRWDPASVIEAGGQRYAHFTNLHAAAYLLNRDQLGRAIATDRYVVAPHEGRYGILESAAADPYDRCGFRKMVGIDRFDDFLIRHQPNKYLGELGATPEEVAVQLDALRMVHKGSRSDRTLSPLSSALDDSSYDRHLFDRETEALVRAVPPGARRIVSVGSGAGYLESELDRNGHQVVAVPVDAVMGEVAGASGLSVVDPDLSLLGELDELSDVDCVVVAGLAHLAPEPADLLAAAARALRPGGSLVVSVPNLWAAKAKDVYYRLPARKRPRSTWTTFRAPDVSGGYEDTGMHDSNPVAIRRWLRAAGLNVTSVDLVATARTRSGARLGRGPLGNVLMDQIIATARR